jgi:hypothetical protein
MRTPRTDESISESTRERREKLLGAALRRVSVRCVLSDWDDMREHLGRSALASDGATYTAFEKAFWTLAHSAELHSDTRRLDRYWWIVGQCRKRADPGWTINSEIRRVFEDNPPELAVAAGDPSWMPI